MTDSRDQVAIQNIGCYIATPREEPPEEVKKNIEATVNRIRERGGVIEGDDLVELNKTDRALPRKTIGIISIIRNPTVLFYYMRINKKPMWRLLRFNNAATSCLDILEHKMSDALELLGIDKFKDFKHSLIGFSIQSPPGVKLRNGFIYSVGPSNTQNLNLTPRLERSISPVPRQTTPRKQRSESAPQLPTPRPNVSPRFQLTPLKIGGELQDLKDLTTIKIKNLMAPQIDLPTPGIDTDQQTTPVDKHDTDWRQTTLDLGKGIILHLKYRIEITGCNEIEPTKDSNRNPIPDTSDIPTIESQKPKRKKSKKSQQETETQTKRQKENPPQKSAIQLNNPTPKATKEKKVLDKPKEIQLYKNQPKSSIINPLISTNKTYQLEGTPPRKISTMLLRHFIETFTIRNPKDAQVVLLNLPKVAADSSQDAVPIIEHKTSSIEKRIQTLFTKGKYADAYTLATNGESNIINPEYSQVKELFPSDDSPNEIEEIANMHPQTTRK